MTDLDINIALAKAMGWQELHMDYLGNPRQIIASQNHDELGCWHRGLRKVFDYRDPVIFVAICKRWKLNIYHRYSEVSYVDDNGTDFSIENNSIEKAAALCVIDAVKRGVK